MSSPLPWLRVAIAVAMVIALSSRPSFAALTFVGGNAVQQASVQRIYDGLPACCQSVISIRVQLLDDRTMDGYLQAIEGVHASEYRNDAVHGIYVDSSGTLSLRVSSATADPSNVFAHEYGHFVWQRLLTRAQRDEYSRVYKIEAARHALVSAYAGVSLEEGFAEAFSYFVRDRSTLEKCDPLSCHCLDAWMTA